MLTSAFILILCLLLVESYYVKLYKEITVLTSRTSCIGVFLSPRLVLTTANCVIRLSLNQTEVLVDTKKFPVLDVYIPKEYKSGEDHHNIAILYLESYIPTQTLHLNEQHIYGNFTCKMITWASLSGKNKFDSIPVMTLDKNTCQKSHGLPQSSSALICAIPHHIFLHSALGAPLYCDGLLTGLAIDYTNKSVTAFANVSEYLSFIYSIANRKGDIPSTSDKLNAFNLISVFVGFCTLLNQNMDII